MMKSSQGEIESFVERQSNAPGWRLDDEGRLVREKIPRMTRRLVGWDYRDRAIYQITVVLEDRRSNALGRLVVGVADDQSDAKIELSPLGEAVLECWRELPAQWPGVEVLAERVMPDHFHGIVFVKKRQEKTLGNIIGSFKSRSTSRIRALSEGTSPHAAKDKTGAARRGAYGSEAPNRLTAVTVSTSPVDLGIAKPRRRGILTASAKGR